MSRRGENIYKRKDGRWEGRILMDSGKYRYLYAKSYKEVKERMRSFLEQKEKPAKKSFGKGARSAQLFEDWLMGDIKTQVKPSTYESYYWSICKYIIPFFQRPGNEQLDEDSVTRFVKSIREDASIPNTSAKKILSIFKIALKSVLKRSPEYLYLTQLIIFPKAEEKEVEIFSMKEQRMIEYAALRSGNKRALGIILCFYTGLRLGELCALKWSDVDLESGTLSITHTVSRIKNFKPDGKKTILCIGTPKSRKSTRRIPIPEFLLNFTITCGLYIQKEDNYIMSGKKEPYEPRCVQKLYKEILERAGVKERKFHAIRHTFATRALELGVDVKTLSEILGHSNVGITLNVYVHSLMEHKKIAIEKFNDMLLTDTEFTDFAVNSAVAISEQAR